MSNRFNAILYIRVFSEAGDRAFDSCRWKVIPLRTGEGFNYLSKYIFFEVHHLKYVIDEVLLTYRADLTTIKRQSDDCELYIWLDNKLDMSTLNGADIGSSALSVLGELGLELRLSVDALFPSYDDCHFKDSALAPLM